MPLPPQSGLPIGRGPVIIANPRDDDAFAKLVQQLVGDHAGTPGDLQAALRAVYPDATVHVRELSGEPVAVWYVYRDGRWIRPSKPVGG